uniref:Borealin C-terminal domain-containing protein n=1 Tax=Gorilla gorilla gorilla TaxID=9595 RepID=A0A2I2ZS59_GORGO
MAPRKGSSWVAKTNSLGRWKLPIESVRQNLFKEVDNLYNIQILWLPKALRKDECLNYFSFGGNKQGLEEAATADLDITEISKLTAEAVIQVDEMIVEENEEEENKRRDLQTARVKRTQSVQGKGRRERSSCANTVTQTVVKPTPGLIPRFDLRVFMIPGLCTPATGERIYNISGNGSPLAHSKEIFLTVPAGGKECIDLQRLSIALGNIKKLSNHLAQICSSTHTHK